MDNIAEKIAYMVSKRGGRAYYVGGFVRDKILGIAANDTDGKDVDGKDVEMIVKVGDKVLTSKYSGTEVKVDGEECTIVRQSDILAIVE